LCCWPWRRAVENHDIFASMCVPTALRSRSSPTTPRMLAASESRPRRRCGPVVLRTVNASTQPPTLPAQTLGIGGRRRRQHERLDFVARPRRRPEWFGSKAPRPTGASVSFTFIFAFCFCFFFFFLFLLLFLGGGGYDPSPWEREARPCPRRAPSGPPGWLPAPCGRDLEGRRNQGLFSFSGRGSFRDASCVGVM
jgi:hypothetical protein